jgi:hypothetical protein
MKYTTEEINSVEQYLVMKTESDADFDELFHEWEVVRSIVEQNHAQEWLDALVDQFLDNAKEWEQDSE